MAESEEITALVNREVYSKNGVHVGSVEDVQLDLDAEAVTGLALADVNRELFEEQLEGPRQGVIIPYRWVQAVGDVILVNDVVERLREDDEDEDVAV